MGLIDMATNVERRRRIRAIEAKIDSLRQTKETTDSKLKQARAELKHERSKK